MRWPLIILFSDIFNRGGIETYNRYLYNAFKTEFKERSFITISLNTNTNAIPRFVRKIIFVWRILFVLFSEKSDFLICAHVHLSPIGLLFKKFTGLKYAVLTHGIEVWNLKSGLRHAGLINAEIITAVSQYTKNKMVKNGILEDKIRLLQDTINVSLFYPKKANQELKNKLELNDRRILLTVGRVNSAEKYKGHDVMLKVLQELGEEYIWLVVGDGDDLPRLRKKAYAMGIAEKVKFLGGVENQRLFDYYNLCEVFIMPSKGEGFGIVFLEALACGKPVIAGNCDGSEEPLMNGNLGFMVDPDSPEEIIRAINSVFTLKENRTNPEYLRKQVEENFGVKVFNKRVKEIFRDCFHLGYLQIGN